MLKKSKFSLLAIAFAMFVGIFVSCAPQAQNASIIGNWKSEWDGYVITEKEITYDDGGYGLGWSGKIEEIKDPYIYVSFEQDGKTLYRVTAFQNVTDVSANIANAYKDGKQTCDSLEEVKTDFTIDNGYFGYFGEYVRN